MSLSFASVLVMSVKSRKFSLKTLAERLGRPLAHLAVGVLQLVERRLEGELLAIDIETQRRHRLIEEPVPGRGPAHRFLEEEALELVLELMRLLPPDVLEPGPIMRERLRGRGLRERLVVELIELELEEEDIGLGFGQPFLRVAIELGAKGIAGVPGIDEAGIGHEAAHQLVEPLVARDRLVQGRAALAAREQAGELAAIGRGECLAFLLRMGEVALELGRVHRGIEIAEIPFRQDAEFRGSRSKRGLAGLAGRGPSHGLKLQWSHVYHLGSG